MISTGAEFSVAMDTAGLVYVWGRADNRAGKIRRYMDTFYAPLSVRINRI